MDNNDSPTVKTPKPLSSYFDAFRETSTISKNTSKGSWVMGGEPIFTREDIFKVNQSLAQLLRYILVMHNVTWQEYMDKITIYGHHLNITPRDLGILKGNLKKEVLKTKVSFNKLEQIVCSILGFSIENLTLSLIDKTTGQTYQHSIRDIEQLFKDEPDLTCPAPKGYSNGDPFSF